MIAAATDGADDGLTVCAEFAAQSNHQHIHGPAAAIDAAAVGESRQQFFACHRTSPMGGQNAQHGDLLFTQGEGSPGEVCLAPSEVEGASGNSKNFGDGRIGRDRSSQYGIDPRQ